MEKNKRVHIGQLKGYRVPTEEEKKKIYRCMQPELQTRRKQMKLFRNIFACFASAVTGGAFLETFDKIFNYAEFVICIVIAIAFWGGFVALHKSLVTNRILEAYVKDGNYQLLECIPLEHSYNQDPTRLEGSVQIQTTEGIPCIGNFVIDIETALLCESEKGKGISLLLMYERETGESRVFSERMLSQG